MRNFWFGPQYRWDPEELRSHAKLSKSPIITGDWDRTAKFTLYRHLISNICFSNGATNDNILTNEQKILPNTQPINSPSYFPISRSTGQAVQWTIISTGLPVRQILFNYEMPVITVAFTYAGICMITPVVFFFVTVPQSLCFLYKSNTPTHNTTTTLQGSIFEFNHRSPDDDSGVNSASIFSHLSQCEPDLGSSFSDVWNQIPFLFVSIHLLCLYILYLKYCFECTVGDTITYNGT
jgi:hypothetical protein